MRSYKRRIWDGKIRLYSVATNEVYVGLLPYIEEFAKRNEIDIEYKEGILNERKYETTNWIDLLEECHLSLREKI